MSTLTSPSHPLDMRLSAAPAAKGVYTPRPHFDGARGLAALLLAALVAAMVVVADRLISTWADGHLLLAWVLLWLVVFATLALFASTARSMAKRTVRVLDGWSRSMAEARAEARLWDMARQDPRLMSELVQARMRESEDVASPVAEDDFGAALAPLGMEARVNSAARLSSWDRFVERLSEQRRANLHLHYI